MADALLTLALFGLAGCARPTAVQTTPADAVPRWIETSVTSTDARVIALYDGLDTVGIHEVDARESWRSEFIDLGERVDDLLRVGPETLVTAHARSGKVIAHASAAEGWTHEVLVQVEPAPLSIDLADLDLDGIEDLIVISDGPRAKVRLFRGLEGPNAFDKTPQILPLDPKGRTSPTLLVLDLDGTRSADIVLGATTGDVTAPVPDHVRLLRSGGTIGLIDETMVRVPSPIHLHAGDVDEDGLPDILAAGPVGAWLLHSIGHGWFDEPRPLARGNFSGGAIVDLHGDGHLDIVLADHEDSRLEIFRGAGAGRLSPPAKQDVGEQPIGLTVVARPNETLLVTANASSESSSFTTVAYAHE